MSDSMDADNSNHIGDLVDDAVSAHTKAPVVPRSCEFAAAGWPRILRERSQGIRNARSDRNGQALQVFLGRPFHDDLIHPSVLREIGEHIFQRPVV
jgi:hypothetical protein